MKCANAEGNREIFVYRRGCLSKRRYCSKHCRDAFVPQKLIAFLIGARNRFTVLATWLWAYLTFRASSRLITGGGV